MRKSTNSEKKIPKKRHFGPLPGISICESFLHFHYTAFFDIRSGRVERHHILPKSHKSMRKASGGRQKQVESIPDGYRRAIENLPRDYAAGRPMVKMRWRRDLPVTGKAAGSSEWLWVLFMPQYALPTLEEEGGV